MEHFTKTMREGYFVILLPSYTRKFFLLKAILARSNLLSKTEKKSYRIA